MGFTDIRLDLIDRLPLAARPYAVMMRLDRPTGWWLLLLPGWWAIALAGGGINGMGAWDWYLMVLFFFGAIIMRGAGCIINDLWDRDLDARVERTRLRPLASGVIKPWQAILLLCVLLFLGLFILLQTGTALAIWLGIASLAFIAVYPYMKRITWWPQAFLGLTFNFGVLIGWAAATGRIDIVTLVLYLGAVCWTLGYDTIYAHQDRDDDEMAGIRSTALLFGARSKKWVAIFYAAAWTLLAGATFFATDSIIAQGLILLPGLHLLLQVLIWNPDSQASSLRWFKANRDCGFLFLLVFLTSGL